MTKRGNLTKPAPNKFAPAPVVFDLPERITNSSSRPRLTTTHQQIRDGAEDASRPRIRSIT